MTSESPLTDLVAESDRVLAAAVAARVEVKLLGGLAVRRLCHSASKPPLARSYADLDLAITGKTPAKTMNSFMSGLGYTPHDSFNALHGDRRLYYHDVPNDRHVDVFVDTFRMCHTLNLKPRVPLCPETLPASDLLLTKLQVVELNHKDMLDILALLEDLPAERGRLDGIDLAYLEGLWADDWPLWRTCLETTRKVRRALPGILDSDAQERVLATLEAVEGVLSAGRHGLAWRLRSRVGDRIKWYELPEEVGN